ncbi:ABC transporter ATP-binding protein/permease [Actinomyces sp. B33]|uniref:ABC transporter ATP-binding protein n=1 Tax=Actinomyces sp. B33 TaxID=2942131 RepID=UPI002341D44E|nr:ABC transporter ATP-binding protein [Actinomyces sp. B33]MDC4233473.1 ABC transporter ATP-binding protein/permease [Actinomyces sp. B33]
MSKTPHSGGLLLPRYERLMAHEDWGKLRTGMTLGLLVGILRGLGLLVLIPVTTTLAGSPGSFGLGSREWLVVLGAIAVAAVVLDFLGVRIGYFGALGFVSEVHRRIGDKVAALPLGWFRRDTGARLSRMVTQEMLSLGESVGHFIYSLVVQTATAIVITLGAWLWDWRLGLLLTASAPVLLAVLALSRRILDHGKSISEPREEEIAARTVEFAQCQRALRANGASAGYPELAAALDAARVSSRRALWWETLSQLLSGIAVQTIIVSFIVVAAQVAAVGSIAPLPAVATLGLILCFTAELNAISSALFGLEDRRQQMDRIDEVMDAPLLPAPETSAPMTAPGSVALTDVGFSYDHSRQVLDGITFTVPARTMCAIVGPSGSGKTTILRLISRFYDATSGTIRVGGSDVREMTTEDLMAELAMVFQDVYLFDDTLEANVRVGRADATDEEVARAIDLAGVTEIIDRLPLGAATRVGEGGRSLSGGERQRVSIARALLKRAPIVLFDEATSALDVENERHFVASMERLRATSTLIVVAHKLETIMSADQIIMLDADGRIAQRGTHDRLVEADGPYRDFWGQRHRARGWSLVE